jgi:hypothetical protein
MRGVARVGRRSGRNDRVVDAAGCGVGTSGEGGLVELVSSAFLGCAVGEEAGEEALVTDSVRGVAPLRGLRAGQRTPRHRRAPRDRVLPRGPSVLRRASKTLLGTCSSRSSVTSTRPPMRLPSTARANTPSQSA